MLGAGIRKHLYVRAHRGAIKLSKRDFLFVFGKLLYTVLQRLIFLNTCYRPQVSTLSASFLQKSLTRIVKSLQIHVAGANTH